LPKDPLVFPHSDPLLQPPISPASKLLPNLGSKWRPPPARRRRQWTRRLGARAISWPVFTTPTPRPPALFPRPRRGPPRPPPPSRHSNPSTLPPSTPMSTWTSWFVHLFSASTLRGPSDPALRVSGGSYQCACFGSSANEYDKLAMPANCYTLVIICLIDAHRTNAYCLLEIQYTYNLLFT
jgi:hypothetical protein